MTYSVMPDRNSLIRESYFRCEKANLKRTRPIDQKLTTYDKNKLYQENQLFLEYSIKVFEEHLSFYLRNTGHSVSLMDANGRVLYVYQEPGFTQKNTVSEIGVNWSESYRGTNAVGIVLIEKAPVIVKGTEHFYPEHSTFNCAASPIFTKKEGFRGVVNVYRHSGVFDPVSFSMATMAAKLIQNRLDEQFQQQQYSYLEQELEKIFDKYQAPIVSTSPSHRILKANRAAKHILGRDCVGEDFFPDQSLKTETISSRSNPNWKTKILYQTQRSNHQYTFSDIKGSCPKLKEQVSLAKKAAEFDLPVLILGESGTGKELVSQSIHSISSRSDKPFIAINCAAIPENLVVSEMFGYKKGAFTGADQKGSEGKFLAANGGTIFLDEIGDMTLSAQSVLLRVLQEKMVTPIGGIKPIHIDIRVIAATHKNLIEEVEKGKFRADLYYRLKGITLRLPSLSERSDVLELAEEYLQTASIFRKVLSPEAKRKIEQYHWPGNIRELHSVLAQAVVLSDGHVIGSKDIQIDVMNKPEERLPLSLEESEKRVISDVLNYCNWNIQRSAKLLGITRNRLYRKIELYDIKKEN
ncbi:sigma-54-dependent Fis family transcriptional regulator [Bacillus vallismortis]|uniref:sigma-54-dependent Fis family transcriptional regulator n=1 Tax=Bacillus vallismortis TaxID=72361 RepID=UPI0013CF06FD|nr:sigma-54-dependent Fis family transcriptional regulator [Bacillus vallismortis]